MFHPGLPRLVAHLFSGSYTGSMAKRILTEPVASMDPSVLKSPTMVAKKAPKKQSKSDYIRSQPATMSASEVVAAAKAAGIKLSGNLVYMVRGAKGSTKKTASKPPGRSTAGKVSIPKTTTSKTAGKTATSKKATVKKETAMQTKESASPGTAKSAGVSKSEFIRMHPGLSVAEVVAAGKDQGLSFSTTLVYAVRGETKSPPSKKGTAKRTSAKTSDKKTSTIAKTATLKKPGVNKADFVRQNPSLSANEVAAKAKAGGITLDANYVYKVRGADKAATKKKRAAKKLAASIPVVTKTSKPTASKPVTSNGTRPSGSVEELLKAAAAELGLGRAMEILEGERARVRKVIGG